MKLKELLVKENLFDYVSKNSRRFGRTAFDSYDKVENGIVVYGCGEHDYKVYIKPSNQEDGYCYAVGVRPSWNLELKGNTESNFSDARYNMGYEKLNKTICWLGTALYEWAIENDPMKEERESQQKEWKEFLNSVAN